MHHQCMLSSTARRVPYTAILNGNSPTPPPGTFLQIHRNSSRPTAPTTPQDRTRRWGMRKGLSNGTVKGSSTPPEYRWTT